MRVLAVDPGYDRLGVAVLEKHDAKEVVLYSNCIETDKQHSLPKRLHQLGGAFRELLEEYQPMAVGIETLFFNKNQKTAMGVAQARGIIMFLAQEHQCAVYEFGPQEIKTAVTGYGNSDKRAVMDMLHRLVDNVPQTALDDEYDAIAIGVTTLAHHRLS